VWPDGRCDRRAQESTGKHKKVPQKSRRATGLPFAGLHGAAPCASLSRFCPTSVFGRKGGAAPRVVRSTEFFPPGAQGAKLQRIRGAKALFASECTGMQHSPLFRTRRLPARGNAARPDCVTERRLTRKWKPSVPSEWKPNGYGEATRFVKVLSPDANPRWRSRPTEAPSRGVSKSGSAPGSAERAVNSRLDGGRIGRSTRDTLGLDLGCH
jgi:hypothetical protein